MLKFRNIRASGTFQWTVIKPQCWQLVFGFEISGYHNTVQSLKSVHTSNLNGITYLGSPTLDQSFGLKWYVNCEMTNEEFCTCAVCYHFEV
jgi:hypothetical protein